MKIRVRYEVPRVLMGKYKGKVLYPYVLFKEGRANVTETIMRHELEHVYQIKELGVLKFYLSYITEWLKKGYRNNKYEVAARAAQTNPLTPEERALFYGDNAKTSMFWQYTGVLIVTAFAVFLIVSYQ